MEYSRTEENYTPIDVYFDGEKYVFINRFHGCVAIARRDLDKLTEENHAYFQVELTPYIEETTIKRTINKMERRYVHVAVTYSYHYEKDMESLPYFISVKVERNEYVGRKRA